MVKTGELEREKFEMRQRSDAKLSLGEAERLDRGKQADEGAQEGNQQRRKEKTERLSLAQESNLTEIQRKKEKTEGEPDVCTDT